MNLLFTLSADFSVIKPTFGLLIWTTVFFLLFWFIIGKFAFRPIAEALKKREGDIQDALDSAAKAKAEMENLHAENERIMQEAREERNKMIKEAKDTQLAMINEAKNKAKEEASKLISSANEAIENQKRTAMEEVKNEVGTMAMDIAEKLLRKELKGNNEHTAFVDKLVKEIDLN